MVFEMIGRSFKTLFKQPARTLGLVAFASLLSCLGFWMFCGVPAIGYVIFAVLTASLCWMFLRTLRGETLGTRDMFAPFRDWKTFKRVAIGMLWRDLWILIWGLIPFAGIVFAIMKAYEYRLVPYLLLDDPELDPLDALKVSSEKTKGYRGKMFLSDLVILGAYILLQLFIGLFTYLFGRYTGSVVVIVWLLISGIILCIFVLLAVLVEGFLHAGYYQEIEHPTPRPQRVRKVEIKPEEYEGFEPGVQFCTRCGAKYRVGEAKFCAKCGNPLE